MDDSLFVPIRAAPYYWKGFNLINDYNIMTKKMKKRMAPFSDDDG
jgi:hypothetical protein